MSIIRGGSAAREIYASAAEKKWVIPCFCSENLTTTEAIMAAAEEFRAEKGLERLPVTIAITIRYPHRSQSTNYTHTRRWDVGLKLFTADALALADEGGAYPNLDVMLHLDHAQYDLDAEFLTTPLRDYASVMYDASAIPMDKNIDATAKYVRSRKGDILIEGACDEIVDATGSVHNALTTPERAEEFISATGVDLIVANLGTEHRATGKNLAYHGDVARSIKSKIGEKIVLHGTSSVTNEQVRGLFGDGVCKVNIWTALERDSSPALFTELVRNASRVAGPDTVEALKSEGLLGASAEIGKPDLAFYTTLYRQTIVFERMKKMVRDYLDMWYVL